jgi:hypothetical protein
MTAHSTSVGFRIKSGYAIAVVLEGSRQAPAAVARQIVELSDPEAAETRQPYHHGFGKEENDEGEIARRIAIVRRCAARAVGALLRDACRSEPDGTRRRERNGPRQAGLVVGSVIEPQQVGNPHIRAHASEGKLFRTVVEEALRAHGVPCTIFLEKQLSATAAGTLGRDEGAIKRTVAELGKTVGGPWRADEKAAAIAAWLTLLGD